MSLYLVQHGRSLPEEVDPGKGLSPEGRADVERIAGTAKHYGVHVSEIWQSGKKRARETAEIMHSVVGSDRGIVEKSGMDPKDDVVPFWGMVPDDDIMLVGHMPFMSRLASFLVTGSVDRPIMKFQNGGIVCLGREPDSKMWIIRWTLMPAIR